MARIYKVGGVVRDKLLGRPEKDRDWVVVGSTPEEMLKLGYQAVGKDFPVFLHPKTKEEYALARTERKSGQGYHGFICSFEPDVTLEEDLKRRDLTINAIAEDENGDIIDPYHGLADLKNKMLRHVSEAFVEDPLRVLRVARFAARFEHLGFTVAPETLILMQDIVKSGEMTHLTPERVWREWELSLNEKNPSTFIKVLRHCGALQQVIPEVDSLFSVQQTAAPHFAEGIFSLKALDKATQLSEQAIIKFAALCHNLDKKYVHSSNLSSHADDEKNTKAAIKIMVQRLKIPNTFSQLAMNVATVYHPIHSVFEQSAEEILTTFQKSDAFRKPEKFFNILLACQAIFMARTENPLPVYPQITFFRRLFSGLQNLDLSAITQSQSSGKAIGDAIKQCRINFIAQFQQYGKY
ncbi:MAG: multifunctional CCA addition/repair protein [Pseudomonadota bacterium]